MRKIKFIAMYFMAAMLTLGITACGSDSNDDSEPTVEPGGKTDTPALTVQEQKQQMEKTAREFMNKVSANEFQNIADMTSNITNSDDDDDAVNDWFEACVKSCELAGSTDDNLKYMYAAANFKGKFELSNGTWKHVGDADNLQFSFNDKNGKSCTLTAEASGKTTQVHNSAFDDEDEEYYYDYDYAKYRSNITRYEISYAIPEKIHVTLTQAGSTVADVTINTTVNIASGDFDYTRDNAQVSVIANINDYNFSVSKIAFNAGEEASATVAITKNGEELLACSASATGKLYSAESGKDPIGKNGEFVLRVLGGKVRAEGTISDISAFADDLSEAIDNDDNESRFKSYIDKANSLINVNLYFDDSKNSSAKMELYPTVEEVYEGITYWEYEPCVKFDDGTRYSFMEYFDENTYSGVIDQFNTLIDNFVKLFDKR